MTTPQRITLMAEWWPAACRAQGWQDTRELRLRVLSIAVSLQINNVLDVLNALESDAPLERPITSATQLDNRADIDRVKAVLGMLADNVQRTQEVGEAGPGQARRYKNKIRQFAPRLVERMLHDRFTWPVWLRRTYPDCQPLKIKEAPNQMVELYRAEQPSPPALEDLNPVELRKLLATLVAITGRKIKDTATGSAGFAVVAISAQSDQSDPTDASDSRLAQVAEPEPDPANIPF